MIYQSTSCANELEILKYDHKIAKTIELDFTNVSATENGVKVVKAGTPIKIVSNKGVVGNASTDSPVGILWKNCYETNPNGTVIVHGIIDKSKAETASGLTYAAFTVPALIVLD